MAVLKHIAIKNADYSAAVCYLKYQHDERHLKPLLDENGSMMIRSEFHMNGVNCNPDTFIWVSIFPQNPPTMNF